jgi:hypothetical protein
MAKRQPSKYDYANEDFIKGKVVIALIGNERRLVRDIQTRTRQVKTLEGWTANVTAFRTFDDMKTAQEFLNGVAKQKAA